MFIFYALRFWYKIVRSQRFQSKGFARELESTQKDYIAFDNTDNYGRPLTNLSICLSMNVAKSEMNASCCRAPSSWRMVYPQCNRSRYEWRRRPRRRNVSARSRSLMHCSMPARSAWYFYCNWYVPLPVFVGWFASSNIFYHQFSDAGNPSWSFNLSHLWWTVNFCDPSALKIGHFKTFWQ